MLDFQTQLLKLYFLTTLYVDVKEPALPHISRTKKLNFAPRFSSSADGLPAVALAEAGTKLSPICSPKCT